MPEDNLYSAYKAGGKIEGEYTSGIQEAQKLQKEISVGQLEEKYYKSTGTWPPTSIPF